MSVVTLADYIFNGTLFADLQVSLTEIALIELLVERTPSEQSRAERNEDIVHSVTSIMRERFDDDQIRRFLEHGYPRGTASK